MNEVNQKLAENLGTFLMGFSDEVAQGLREYFTRKITAEMI